LEERQNSFAIFGKSPFDPYVVGIKRRSFHTIETRFKLSQNYSMERKERIKNFNLGKSLSKEIKQKISLAASNRTVEQKEKYRVASSKPIEVFLLTGCEAGINQYTFFKKYDGVRLMAKEFKACHKTINKCIKNNTLFRKKYIIKYKLLIN
jgi:hypothetical protein